jgi:hypothetical protein
MPEASEATDQPEGVGEEERGVVDIVDVLLLSFFGDKRAKCAESNDLCDLSGDSEEEKEERVWNIGGRAPIYTGNSSSAGSQLICFDFCNGEGARR